MRKVTLFNDGWTFSTPGKDPITLSLPHTWNGTDGQDGGNDYLRTTCIYTKRFKKPELKSGETAVMQFRGVNSECEVFLNGSFIVRHEGGYSTFNAYITDHLTIGENELEVRVSNEKNDRVYPQRADFTFYGGIYRDVYLMVLPADCLEFGEDAAVPLKLTAKVDGDKGILTAEAYVKGRGETHITVYKGEKAIAQGFLNNPIEIPSVRLWNGKIDPFLYTVTAELKLYGEVLDKVTDRVGFRTFYIDSQKGFFLNGKSYPLRGVCRHQDRPEKGNAIDKADMDEDMDLILEIGATTVRLAHYQHDQYFYDLCDEKGLVVWAEVPYISEHLFAGDDNIFGQVRELVRQNYNHASIVCWGISNEIMIKYRFNTKPIVACHKKCHEFCKIEDPSRLTVAACYSVTRNAHPTAHVTDIVSWNLYFGWYVPFTFLLGWKLRAFRTWHKKTPIGLSEYGAEAMPGLHAEKPKRLDNTEEYQCIYHEKNLKIINKSPYLWATHIWNMFDFGSDGRNQGGEPGKNHKGLVTFDRKIKKDAFYLYKAFWSKEPFVHIAGSRRQNRPGGLLRIKVYTNCDNLLIYHNGKLIEKRKADKILEFTALSEDRNEITVRSSGVSDSAVFYRVAKADPKYKLQKKNKGNNMSWEK